MGVVDSYKKIISEIKNEGLYKVERPITSSQDVDISTEKNPSVLNFCANNYLGLANNSEIIATAKKALDDYGFGMASVRFICGTQTVHKNLEKTISQFFNSDDTILYTSCFDANGGLFETLLTDKDAVISDALNHASIIDGIRLCKAQRYRYKNSDMEDLEKQLRNAKDAKIRMIATDGVFSMDGYIAKLNEITDLAKKYDALVMVDDSHATGFIGKTGRGSAEYHNVMNKVDLWTSTLGKALGGASGGFTTGNQDLIDLLRQRSRPYLFSNTLSPSIASAGIKAFEMLSESTLLRDKLEKNTKYFRNEISKIGFDIKEGEHPIVPIMVYDAKVAQELASALLNEGVYVIGFFYPVVPKNEARIRVQISAAMSKKHIDQAIEAFEKVGKRFKII
ncbi:glycine C-acetyltransferase [bacterium]|nr:MAG: glycine C-acetyltransferase [bacterium]